MLERNQLKGRHRSLDRRAFLPEISPMSIPEFYGGKSMNTNPLAQSPMSKLRKLAYKERINDIISVFSLDIQVLKYQFIGEEKPKANLKMRQL